MPPAQRARAQAGPIFTRLEERFTFVEAHIEWMGSGAGNAKRQDLRFYGANNKNPLRIGRKRWYRSENASSEPALRVPQHRDTR